VAAILDGHRSLIDQPQIRLIDEGGGLQGVIRPFPAQMVPGHAAQLLVHEGQETVQRLIVSRAPGAK
jgi:hypothetical protein